MATNSQAKSRAKRLPPQFKGWHYHAAWDQWWSPEADCFQDAKAILGYRDGQWLLGIYDAPHAPGVYVCSLRARSPRKLQTMWITYLLTGDADDQNA